MELLKASLSFFSTIKVRGDFEKLRNNLWIIPIAGFIIGIAISLISYPLFYLKIGFLSVITYIAIEGINHIDGLADFFDSYFAPNDKKLKALKDLQMGSGGVLSIVIYITILAYSFSKLKIEDYFFAIILGQVLAKQGMLHLMLSSKPLWNGLASEFMKGLKKRDYFSYLFTFSLIFLLSCFNLKKPMECLVAYFITLYLFKLYVNRKYGGINGDMLGALNCIIFAGVIVLWSSQ